MRSQAFLQRMPPFAAFIYRTVLTFLFPLCRCLCPRCYPCPLSLSQSGCRLQVSVTQSVPLGKRHISLLFGLHGTRRSCAYPHNQTHSPIIPDRTDALRSWRRTQPGATPPPRTNHTRCSSTSLPTEEARATSLWVPPKSASPLAISLVFENTKMLYDSYDLSRQINRKDG